MRGDTAYGQAFRSCIEFATALSRENKNENMRERNVRNLRLISVVAVLGFGVAPTWVPAWASDATVVAAAEQEGLATIELPDIVQQVEDAMWQPQYRRIQAS